MDQHRDEVWDGKGEDKSGKENDQGQGREEGVRLKDILKNRIIHFTYKAQVKQNLTDLVNNNLANYQFGLKLVD